MRARTALRLGSGLALLFAGAAAVWFFSGEPYYQGRPVSYWATQYSPDLYPQSGRPPQMPSRKGMEALLEMGPKKAAAALVLTLSRRDSRPYLWYRSFHPRFPARYRARFPLGFTLQELRVMALGAADFLDPEAQSALVPYLFPHLEKPDPARQQAACQLLEQMPAAAAPALPALERLALSANPDVRDAAQSALTRIAREGVAKD